MSARLIGKYRIHLDSVDSTNAEAKRLIQAKKAQEGLVITTDDQHSGRGQYGRVWESKPGQNAIMTVVLTPQHLKIADQFLLNIICSLAVANVVSTFSSDVRVKWPNDVYVRDRKISGILIQNFIQGGAIKNSICGIGINVNQSSWPVPNIRATSFIKETGEIYEVKEVIDQMCAQLDALYKLLRYNPQSLMKAYTDQLYKKDEASMFKDDTAEFSGIIRGVDSIGRLIVEQQGVKCYYMHGALTHLIDKS